jgi:hypothetical protein
MPDGRTALDLAARNWILTASTQYQELVRACR